jgi:hypothetical protein
MSGQRTCAFHEDVYSAVVTAAPSWRRPFPSRVRSKHSSSTSRTAERAQLQLAARGVPDDVAREMSELARRTLNRWVSRDGFRVKIRKSLKKRTFSY